MVKKIIILIAVSICLGAVTLISMALNDTYRHTLIAASIAEKNIFDINQNNLITHKLHGIAAGSIWALPKDKKYPEKGCKGGNILVAHRRAVVELDRKNNLIWQYEPKSNIVTTCQPLDNGNVLVALSNPPKILEIDTTGKIAKEIKLNTKDALRFARKLPNGNYLAVHNGQGSVVEYNQNAKPFNTIKAPGAFAAIRLQNGNTLISCGKYARIVEVTKDSKVVWQLTSKDVPAANLQFAADIYQLPNKNIVIANPAEGTCYPLFEVNKNKKITWKIPENKKYKGINTFDITDQ